VKTVTAPYSKKVTQELPSGRCASFAKLAHNNGNSNKYARRMTKEWER